MKEPVGDLWLQVEASPDGLHAFAAGSKCARISASAAGRATTAVAEQKCREMNVVSIGQTVFGSNKAAQTLYEDLGFKPTVLQMCRRLSRI